MEEAMILCVFMILLSLTTAQQKLPGCQDKCGNVTVPYPFGLIGNLNCYRTLMDINCNHSFNPPKLFLSTGIVEVLDISLEGHLRINNWIGWDCYKDGVPTNRFESGVDMKKYPYTFSHTANIFTAIGCDTIASITGSNGPEYTGGCLSLCKSEKSVINGSCSGVGCCQTMIPQGVKMFTTELRSFYNHNRTSKFNPCSFAFVVEKDWYNFSSLDLLYFQGRTRVPAVVDWAIGNMSCEQVQRREDYACGKNSYYFKATNGPGYLCQCNNRYQGNPYFSDGCQDIDECADKNGTVCDGICTYTPGSYRCSCPPGTHSEQDGIRCILASPVK